ncbi:MAG: aldo/keto reductase [Planctomycetaceae bacterium]|nr:aldo/keto reductase [Planctomycetaceae bacterium]
MKPRPLGNSGLSVSPIGFGSFKIGRNQKAKYPQAYDLPDDAAAQSLMSSLCEEGITYFDTAPAYGISEQRVGEFVSARREQLVLSTKVGETFVDGVSTYDFSATAVSASIQQSLSNLKTDGVDCIFVHSNGQDVEIQNDTDVVDVLRESRASGQTRLIGFSGKSVEGARAALEWADAIMVEYHLDDASHETVMAEAAQRGIGVIVKKGLASGHLDPTESIRFVLSNPAVSSLIVGSLNLDHMRANIRAASELF